MSAWTPAVGLVHVTVTRVESGDGTTRTSLTAVGGRLGSTQVTGPQRMSLTPSAVRRRGWGR